MILFHIVLRLVTIIRVQTGDGTSVPVDNEKKRIDKQSLAIGYYGPSTGKLRCSLIW